MRFHAGNCDQLIQVSSAIQKISSLSMKCQLHFAQKLARGKFAIAVEMDPPRGLSTQKLLAGASLLAEAGADVIDVADSPMARMRMSPWAVCSLIQRKSRYRDCSAFSDPRTKPAAGSRRSFGSACAGDS